MAVSLIGGTNDTGNPAGISNGFNVAGKFTATNNGTMYQFKVVIRTGTSGNLKCAVYADSAGSPGSLLASTTGQAVSAGLNTITISNVSLTNGVSYWLSTNVDTTSIVDNDSTTGNGTSVYKAMTYANPFPDPFGSPDGTPTWRLYYEGFGDIVVPSTINVGFLTTNSRYW